MEDIPLRVTIIVPSNIPELQGRYSTTPPYGAVTTFRAPWDVVDMVDRARTLIDPSLSRALFIRLCVQRVAEAICLHNDEFQKAANEHNPTPPTPVPTIQPGAAEPPKPKFKRRSKLRHDATRSDSGVL